MVICLKVMIAFFHEKIEVKCETCDIAASYKLSIKSCLFMVWYVDVCVWCISSIITWSCTCMDKQNWMYMMALLKNSCNFWRVSGFNLLIPLYISFPSEAFAPFFAAQVVGASTLEQPILATSLTSSATTHCHQNENLEL